jgi:hypothetical protein
MILDRMVVFVGPTLARDEILSRVDAEIRGPAARGDIYIAAKDEPRAVLLIDGNFENVASVFHKEILWALWQGIHVFGSSSIGALRAVELQRFGMIGIGEIFESYKTGRLNEPSEMGWPLLTQPLVDIAATLRHAEIRNQLTFGDREALESAAKSVFWKERTWLRVFQEAMSRGWNNQNSDLIFNWLKTNEVSQKKKDAVLLVEHVRSRWAQLAEPYRPSFHFENTASWQALRVNIDNWQNTLQHDLWAELESQLKKDATFSTLETEALLAILLRSNLENERLTDNEHFTAVALEFRRSMGLQSGEQVLDWLKRSGLQHSDYISLIRHHIQLKKMRRQYAAGIRAEIVRRARCRGFFHQDTNI